MLLKFLLIFALITIISAKTTTKNGTMSFEIVRQKTPFHQILEHGHEIDKTLWKFTKGQRDNDSISLYRFLNEEFYGKIVIGHPGQTLNVAFDVSWDLSWVMSSRCNSIKSIGCWLHRKYNHDQSSEYKKDGRPFFLNLGDFNMTGFYSYDNISFAHSNVTNQSFVEMVTVPNNMMTNKADGVLGLGLKTTDYNPFFYNLLSQKKIKNPIFSIYLNRDRQSTKGGNVMLGFIEYRHIHQKSNLTYLPVDNTPFWQFKMDKVIFNSTSVLCENGCSTIVDTSSTIIIGPAHDIGVIHDGIHAREIFLNRYTVNCDTVNKLPPIDFILNGKPFTLKGPEYTEKLSYDAITVCLSVFQPANTKQEQDRWILGGAFLAEYYSVYNIQEKTIGFAKAA